MLQVVLVGEAGQRLFVGHDEDGPLRVVRLQGLDRGVRGNASAHDDVVVVLLLLPAAVPARQRAPRRRGRRRGGGEGRERGGEPIHGSERGGRGRGGWCGRGEVMGTTTGTTAGTTTGTVARRVEAAEEEEAGATREVGARGRGPNEAAAAAAPGVDCGASHEVHAPRPRPSPPTPTASAAKPLLSKPSATAARRVWNARRPRELAMWRNIEGEDGRCGNSEMLMLM